MFAPAYPQAVVLAVLVVVLPMMTHQKVVCQVVVVLGFVAVVLQVGFVSVVLLAGVCLGFVVVVLLVVVCLGFVVVVLLAGVCLGLVVVVLLAGVLRVSVFHLAMVAFSVPHGCENDLFL